jgi:hypothetical protein
MCTVRVVLYSTCNIIVSYTCGDTKLMYVLYCNIVQYAVSYSNTHAAHYQYTAGTIPAFFIFLALR